MVKEACVLCGEVTGYDVTAPVEVREDYIEGVGQLCRVCGSRMAG